MTSPRRVACSEPGPVAPGQRAGTAVVAGHCRRPAARAALGAAVVLAARLGAELHVLHSTTLDDYDIDPDAERYEHESDVAFERVQVLDQLRGTGLVWAYHEHRGDPASALAALAGEVDAAYLVVGATAPGVLRHLGGNESVTKRLLRLQPRPVLVVPEPHPPHDLPGR